MGILLPSTYPSVLLADTLACAGLLDLLPSFEAPEGVAPPPEAEEAEERLPCAA